MLIGWVIEIMILRETTFTTQMARYQNQAQWQELKNFYRARNEFDRFIKGMPDKADLPEHDEKQIPHEAASPKKNDIGLGKGVSTLQNGQLI
jgi:hypothetical protein